MIEIGRMKMRRRAFFLGMAVFACAAWAEPTGSGERGPLFDMGALLDVDPYDIPALEERFAGGRGASAASKTKGDVSSAPAAAYALARALSLAGEPERTREFLERAAAMLRGSRGADAVRSTLAAHVYLELIVDGPTWTRFNPDLEAAMKAMERTGAPWADMAYVEAKRLALFPPEIGGNLTRSLELYASISAERAPFEYVARYAQALIASGERDRALTLLAKRTADVPQDAAAAAVLGRLRVEDSRATVRAVILPGKLRTAEDRIEGAIRLREGAPISAKTVAEDLRRLDELPGVASADVRYRYDGAANEVQVEYLASEEKSRTLSLFTAGTLHAGPHDSRFLYLDEAEVNGAVVYDDANLFGRAWNLNLISAVVYNKIGLSKERLAGTPLDVSFEAESMLVSREELFFYDEHRYLEDERALTSKYLRGGIGLGYALSAGPRLFAAYDVRKDWYTREEDTPPSFAVPDDLLHTARVGLELDMQAHRGPAGLVPVGLRLGTELEYDYYQGFRGWGSPEFWSEAPDNGLGTLKYGAEAAYGTIFHGRFNAGVALGAYGGSNYYTRTYHRLGGSSGPLDSSLRFLRGYRDDEFYAEAALVGHINAGYELSPGKIHLGLFSDGALISPVLGAVDDRRTVYSAGVSVAAVLPWDIQVYAEYGHGFIDLTGSFDHGHDALSVILIRSFSW